VKVWIEHSNSPHPLRFAPVVQALGAQVHQVVHTARAIALFGVFVEAVLAGTGSPA
jgi:hypothetical protein